MSQPDCQTPIYEMHMEGFLFTRLFIISFIYLCLIKLARNLVGRLQGKKTPKDSKGATYFKKVQTKCFWSAVRPVQTSLLTNNYACFIHWFGMDCASQASEYRVLGVPHVNSTQTQQSQCLGGSPFRLHSDYRVNVLGDPHLNSSHNPVLALGLPCANF